MDGQRITEDEYLALLEDWPTPLIGRTTIGPYIVSTMWTGISSVQPPLIFETVLFRIARGRPWPLTVERVRYATREQAIFGHQRMIGRVIARYGLQEM